DNEVKTYRERVFSKGEILKVTEEEVRGKEKVDINKLEEEKIEIENLRENIQTQIKILFSRNENNKNIILAVNSLGVDLQKQEGEYSIISELSNLANGNNSKRITFERYVLLYHFNEIIQAANIRFRSMTNERYYLQRKVDVGDRRTSQGLDFDVYDNYTGKVRSIGSLSGGESFKASLSLALGLSDVIHSSTGGVRIDTMFVDEGFGTLDPESLEKAIETLLDLGSNGRVVGIISHVSELRERIKSKIEVDKTRQGSSIKIIQE
ncbi:MAG: SbcC/MukB-like Walker B domain-containing protein, partial [Clostridium sp.]